MDLTLNIEHDIDTAIATAVGRAVCDMQFYAVRQQIEEGIKARLDTDGWIDRIVARAVELFAERRDEVIERAAEAFAAHMVAAVGEAGAGLGRTLQAMVRMYAAEGKPYGLDKYTAAVACESAPVAPASER